MGCAASGSGGYSSELVPAEKDPPAAPHRGAAHAGREAAPVARAAEGPVEKRVPRDSSDEVLRFFADVPIFRRLRHEQLEQLEQLARGAHVLRFSRGQEIIREGGTDTDFYLLKNGTAVVVSQQGVIQKLKPGDYFGELALLFNRPRVATITADSNIEVLKITRAMFEEVKLDTMVYFPRRQAVAAKPYYDRQRRQGDERSSLKTTSQRAFIKEALQQSTTLVNAVGLDDDKLQQVANVARRRKVAQGFKLIAQGDVNADHCFIVSKGVFEFLIKGSGGAEKPVGKATQGDVFGELALLYAAPRQATARAVTIAEVWVIDRRDFKQIFMKTTDQKIIHRHLALLGEMEIFSALLHEERRAIAEELVERTFTKGDVIVKEGERGTAMYILIDGEVHMNSESEKRNVKLRADKPKVFGERALLTSEPRSASVVVKSEEATALVVDNQTFNMFLGPLTDLLKRHIRDKVMIAQLLAKANKVPQGGVPVPPNSGSKGARKVRPSIPKKELKTIGLLGTGGFGSVVLVEHPQTKKTYALKAVSKGFVVSVGMQENVFNEKKIQMMVDSPFVIKCYETYNTKTSLYFLMEVAQGGELATTYKRKGFFGSTPHAKFYVAGATCAFNHLHALHVLYRDLKPENMMLDRKGLLKITDMGLSKVVIGKTYTTCGTPDYFAPELLTCAGQTTSLDWWTLGILVFELMTGKPPFEAGNHMEICAKIKAGISSVRFPSTCDPDLRDLVRNLCANKPEDRLPVRDGGIANLREHAWFSGFNWDAFQACSMTPPYIPAVKDPKDMANFFAKKQCMPQKMPYAPDGSNWDKGFATSGEDGRSSEMD